MYTGLQGFYTNGIKMLFYIVPFLPLYISNSMLFPYITGRNFVFRMIVEAAAVLWAGLIVLDRDYRPVLSRIMQAVIVFITVVFAADLFGASFYRSFWSNYERMEGFLMIAHMAAFFVITATVFRGREWKIFSHLVLLGSVGVSLYGLLQQLGYVLSLQGGNRVEGTIGNPTYLAAYLMLAITVALVLFAITEKRWLRYLYAAGALFELLIIYFSATRGAVIAIIGGLAVFAAVFLWLSRANAGHKTARKIALGTLIVALVVPLFFWSIRTTEFVTSRPALKRLTSISLTSQTIESRMLIWRMALKGIRERPILGWGQENFNLIFNKYYHPRLWQQEPWFDHSHNVVLDWLSHAGILGLVSYLSLFAALFYALVRLYVRSRISLLTFSIATAGALAYFVQNLFVFDNFNTYFIFFGALAFMHGYAFQWGVLPTEKRLSGKDQSFGASLIILILALIVGIVAG